MLETISSFSLGWLVGILEGEGCFHFQRSPWGKIYPRITVTSTDYDTLDLVRTLVGVGNIRAGKKQKEHHKQHWVWVIQGPNAVGVMRAVTPFMSARRKARIEEVLQQAGEMSVEERGAVLSTG